MPRVKRQRDSEDYLAMYPRSRKWIHRCITCQRQGFKPQMPRSEWPNLVKYFTVLALDLDGRCDQCAKNPN
jgi:hypothetical protein